MTAGGEIRCGFLNCGVSLVDVPAGMGFVCPVGETLDFADTNMGVWETPLHPYWNACERGRGMQQQDDIVSPDG